MAIDRDEATTGETITGLQNSDDYRDGRQLDDLRTQVATARRTASGVHASAGRRRADADGDAAAVATRRGERDVAAGQADRSWHDVTATALRAGLAALVEPVRGEPVDRAGPLLRGVVAGREKELVEVRRALDTHRRLVADRDRAQHRRDARATLRDTARDALGSRRR